SNWANVSERTILLSHQHGKDGCDRDMVIPSLVKREGIFKQQVLLKVLAGFQRHRRNFRKVPAVGVRNGIDLVCRLLLEKKKKIKYAHMLDHHLDKLA